MQWPTVTVESWEHFVAIASMSLRANYPTRPQYVFEPTYMWRGQADATWVLEPTLTRLLSKALSPAEALEVESSLLRHFMSRAHMYVESATIPSPSDILSWWALMQHHGVPTRALDWSESAYVAAYFAVESLWETDGAIYMIAGMDLVNAHDAVFEDISKEATIESLFTSPTAPTAVLPWHSWRMSERLVAQQGRFTIGTRLIASHAESIFTALFKEAKENNADTLVKLVVPAKLKPAFLYHLRAMNVTATALFPGVDGLGRSLKELARLSAAVRDGALDLDPPEAYRQPAPSIDANP